MDLIPALAALAALQGGQTVEKKNPPFEEMVRMRIVFSVPGMGAVSARRELVYETADGQPLHMDVYSPPGPPRPRPAVILIRGGPIPRTGAKNMGVFVSYGELHSAWGFVAVAFDHRFLAPARLADAGGDVADLVAHVRTNAGSLGVDPERLAFCAFSGGAQDCVSGRGTARSFCASLAAAGPKCHGAVDADSPARWRRGQRTRRAARVDSVIEVPPRSLPG